MDRRTVLAASLTAVGSAVTGCLEGTRNSGDGTDPTGTTEPAETDTTDGGGAGEETTTESPCPDDASFSCDAEFRVVNETAGLAESATVQMEDNAVTVTGVIQGNNGCYTARLAAIEFQEDTLSVRVESYEDRDEGTVCSQAVVSLEYEAVITLADGLPGSVHVYHNGEQVETESPTTR